MAKKKIKPGQVFKHLPTGGTYLIVTRGQIKIPHVGWFKSVTYKDAQGNHYTRFLEDFENKFIRKPRLKGEEKIITSANHLDVAKKFKDLGESMSKSTNSFTEAVNIVTKPI